MTEVVKQLGQTGILGALIIIGVIIVLVPLVLRVAGLTGGQIVDVIKLTLQFFVNIVKGYQAENKVGKVKRK